MQTDQRRIRKLNNINFTPQGPIVYWMSRDQRLQDNWALIYAQELAMENNLPLMVIFCLQDYYLEATVRQYDFMLKGLRSIEKDIRKLDIPFIIRNGSPSKILKKLDDQINLTAIVTDFSPLKVKTSWSQNVNKALNKPLYEVDTHNVVPCWEASKKQEYSARFIRPKIHSKLNDFLTEFPKLKKHPFKLKDKLEQNDWDNIAKDLRVDRKVKPVDWLKPGEQPAKESLERFISNGINHYSEERNNPNSNVTSKLSAYLHFGQISSQRVALEIIGDKSTEELNENEQEFIEQLVVRKELAENFCFYNDNYDSFKGFPDWAKKTLHEHKGDKREYVYSLDEFENAQTHEELWNGAQRNLVKRGYMHGYMRMYWAKKILEWSPSPQEAMRTAIYLNDKYELDGRDPNGYTGVAWAIGGVHDRAWAEREIYGKVRYMNENGARRKFDVDKYIADGV